MANETGNIRALERATGIRVLPNTQLHQLGMPKACHCGITLKRLIMKYGQGHIEQVIDLLVETNNSTELYSATIISVADLLHDHPELLDLGGDLYKLFDGIDMAKIKRLARDINQKKISLTMKTLLYARLHEAIKGEPLEWA